MSIFSTTRNVWKQNHFFPQLYAGKGGFDAERYFEMFEATPDGLHALKRIPDILICQRYNMDLYKESSKSGFYMKPQANTS